MNWEAFFARLRPTYRRARGELHDGISDADDLHADDCIEADVHVRLLSQQDGKGESRQLCGSFVGTVLFNSSKRRVFLLGVSFAVVTITPPSS